MFCHLHVHSEYSLLDGMCRIPQLVARAKELGMDSLALTDHGVMYGVIQFYQAARAAGIKPIIGCEVYVAQEDRFVRNSSAKDTDHLILLAKSNAGYQNLMQLVTKGHLESFYYKPRLDKELLRQHRAGLIALSACLGGEIPRLILSNRLEDAKRTALGYRDIFGEDFYLEVMRHSLPELEKVNAALVSLNRETGIPLVATNDTHYINREDADIHDILKCIGTNTNVLDEKRIKMGGAFYYLKSPAEMASHYEDIPNAITNTEHIAGKCSLSLEFERLHLPTIDLPPQKTADDYLAALCYQNLLQYYPHPTEEIKERLTYELEVIKKTQFANYFLVVWDIISFVRRNSILYGVRGSAAASLVLRCLGITEVDPIENKLVFERFLNIERREMPDIDMDFQDDRREEVIKYVTDKYGSNHVAQIITFGRLGARAALRDVGRALGMPYGDVDRVAKLVPFAVNMTLDRAMTESGELREIYEQDTTVKKLVDTAKKVEGIVRHASTHAAGVVIAKDPLTRYIPLQRTLKGNNGQEGIMTQFTMEDVAMVGLLKMDFLGLINLTILGRTREIIRQTRGKEIDLYRLPMNDLNTFKLLSSGETTGVFQLEGVGMRRYIRDLKPTSFADICAMIALYRPGPMEHIPTYIKAKHGEETVHYPHPVLENILKDTYGVIVYQDQVLFIVQALAGYSLGQADIFRKAMGKKIPEVMQKEKHSFLSGAKQKGFSNEVAEQVFALIEPFAGYAFNKAHSASYALIAYQTAYLKANFPAEYMTALLISHTGDIEKTAASVSECRRLGLPVLPPDVNRSQTGFVIEITPQHEYAIRWGLAAIKNVGESAIKPLLDERTQNGPFKSIEDLCRRANPQWANKRVMESLIKAGACDTIVSNRGSLLGNLDRLLSLSQREIKLKETGQSTMFDLFGTAAPLPTPDLPLTGQDVSGREKATWEKELLGVSLSKQAFISRSKDPGTVLCNQIDAELDGKMVTVIGEVAMVTTSFNKRHETFASVTLEDISGRVEVTVWNREWERTKEFWQEGNIVEVKGRVKLWEERVRFACNDARLYQTEDVRREGPLSNAVSVTPPSESSRPARRVVINLKQTGNTTADLANLDRLINIFKASPGPDEASLRIVNGTSITNLKLGLFIGYTPEMQSKLLDLVGEGGIRVENG